MNFTKTSPTLQQIDKLKKHAEENNNIFYVDALEQIQEFAEAENSTWFFEVCRN